jgi:hypothetical protein
MSGSFERSMRICERPDVVRLAPAQRGARCDGELGTDRRTRAMSSAARTWRTTTARDTSTTATTPGANARATPTERRRALGRRKATVARATSIRGNATQLEPKVQQWKEYVGE